MANLSIVKPATIQETLTLLDQQTMLLAGGTDVIIQVKKNQEIRRLVDINHLLSAEIEEKAGEIVIGALVTHTQALKSPLIVRHMPVLAAACIQVAAPQIRNVGTIGGNIANASPAGDTIPALMVLQAKVNYVTAEGEHTLPLADFLLGPGQTALHKRGIITGVSVPKQQDRFASFIKIGKRNALAISICNCAVSIVMEGDIIAKSLIAVGAVAPKVIYLPTVQAYLDHKRISDIDWAGLNAAVLEAVKPISDIRSSAEYRQQLTEVITRRALLQTFEQIAKGRCS